MKERIIAACIAIVAAGSMVMASLFASPADVLHTEKQSYAPAVEAQVVVVAPDDDDDDAEDEERARRKGVRAILRGWLAGLPFPARAVLIMPLYIAGSLLSALLAAAFAAVKPLLSAAVGFLACAALKFALLTGLFALLFHALFPGRSLREFFTKKNMLALAFVGLLLTAADRLMPRFFPRYALLRAGAITLLELAALFAVWYITFGYKSLKGYPVRRIFRSSGWLSLLLALAAASLLRFGLELLTFGSFWSFLPDAIPFFVLAVLFAVLVWRRSRPKRHHYTSTLAPGIL